MIRVAQMMLAEVFRSYFRHIGSHIDPSYIISAFLESEFHPKYPVSRFVQVASTLFLKKPGDWFSINEIAQILQSLHESAPLKGSEHLKVIICN